MNAAKLCNSIGKRYGKWIENLINELKSASRIRDALFINKCKEDMIQEEYMYIQS